MKRYLIISLLAIVSLFTFSTSMCAETENANSVPALQLCFTGVPNAVFQIYSPTSATVDLSNGPTSVLAENYLNIGGALFSFSVSSTTNVPITKVIVIYGSFREDVEIIDTFDGAYQVHVPVIQSNSTQLVYITAYTN